MTSSGSKYSHSFIGSCTSVLRNDFILSFKTETLMSSPGCHLKERSNYNSLGVWTVNIPSEEKREELLNLFTSLMEKEDFI